MSRDSERRLRAARDAAESASQRKSDFLSSVSHEIRTPLNTVLGMAELLGETNLDERQRRYVRTLQRAGDHLLALVDEVLDLTRIEAGSVHLEQLQFDVLDLTESAIEIVRVGARRKQLEIECSIAPDIPRVLRGDVRRLRQVLVNLLGNAVKFTHRGRITVGVTCASIDASKASDTPIAKMQFTVRDTGIGIPPDRLSAIFSGFIQGDSSIARTYGGFGLGLDIAKRIVERMGGTIWAESVLGQGSCFHVALPLPIELDAMPSRVSEDRAVARLRVRGADGAALHVLVVDDSEDNRVLLGEFLSAVGVVVEFAHDGATALDIGANTPFDVILMDLQMPELDGYATTRALLRSIRERGRVPPPIIALSAHALQSSLARSIEAGCVQQLTKPIRKRVLVEAVARVCGATLSESTPQDDLNALLGQFLANRQRDVGALRNALAKGDYEVITTLAHNMRGTGTSYGFPELSAIGDELEAAANERHVEACRASIDRLATTVARITGSKRTISGTRERATVPQAETKRSGEKS